MTFTVDQTPAFQPAFNGESKVLLDGELVIPYRVNPTYHRYLGPWRPPINPLIPQRPVHSIICYCAVHIRTYQEAAEHYRKGCCDLLQYVSINKKE